MKTDEGQTVFLRLAGRPESVPELESGVSSPDMKIAPIR